jgi:hypothetical protein
MKISEQFPTYQNIKSSATNDFISFKMQHHIHDDLYVTIQLNKESVVYPLLSNYVSGKDYFRFSFGTKNGFDIMHREYYDTEAAYITGLAWMNFALKELKEILNKYE